MSIDTLLLLEGEGLVVDESWEEVVAVKVSGDSLLPRHLLSGVELSPAVTLGSEALVVGVLQVGRVVLGLCESILIHVKVH